MLLDYNFTIKYQLTYKIGQADTLSRLMDYHHKQLEITVVAAVSGEPEVSTEHSQLLQ